MLELPKGVFVGGTWIPGAAGEMPAVSPSSGEAFATVDVADAAQATVAAARITWSTQTLCVAATSGQSTIRVGDQWKR